MKLLTSDEATKILQPKLSTAKGKLTVSDAAAATGMAIEDARTALETLMNRYTCRLQITESGEILYDFGRTLRRRGEKGMGEILADVWTVAWKGITILFKIWISVTLIVYFIIFVLILLAILAALKGKDNDGFDFIGDLFGDIFAGIGRGLILVDAVDSSGYSHKSYRQTKRKAPQQTEQKKRFVQSVYDFVLGPPRPTFDPFTNEKEVLAWLRGNNGVLTVTEVVALAGWTYEQAEERFTDYLTRFKGEAEITSEGVLVGRFREVMSTGDGSMEGGKVELFWDEFEAPYEVTGNTAGRNAFILFMNFFNLVWAFVFAALDSTDTEILEVLPDWLSLGAVNIVLGWIPLLYSIAVFILPLVRAFVVSGQESARVERNKRRRILRSIFDMSARDMTLVELLAVVNGSTQKPLTEKEFGRLFEEIAVEYHGIADITDEGLTVFRFDRIRREHATAVQARSSLPLSQQQQKVIFDTGTDAPGSAPPAKA